MHWLQKDVKESESDWENYEDMWSYPLARSGGRGQGMHIHIFFLLKKEKRKNPLKAKAFDTFPPYKIPYI